MIIKKHHSWNLNYKDAVRLQKKLANKIILSLTVDTTSHSITTCHHFFKRSSTCQADEWKKWRIFSYEFGESISPRTIEVTPNWSVREMKPVMTIRNHLNDASLEKQSLNW